MKFFKGIVFGIVVCFGLLVLMSTDVMAAGVRVSQSNTQIFTSRRSVQVNEGVPIRFSAFFGDGVLPSGASLPAVCIRDLAFLFQDRPSRFSFKSVEGTDLDIWIERGVRFSGGFGFGLFGFNEWGRRFELDSNGDVYLPTDISWIFDEVTILDYSRRFVQVESERGTGWISPRFFARPQGIPRVPDESNDVLLWRVIQSIWGYWVDSGHFNDDFITSSVAFPRRFGIREVLIESLSILVEFNIHRCEGEAWVPLMIDRIDGNLVTLKYNTSYWKNTLCNCGPGFSGFGSWTETDEAVRIVVDTSQNPVQSIRLYAEGRVYQMIRAENIPTVHERSRFSYHMIDGGLRLGWIFNQARQLVGEEIALFRSTSPDEKGELLMINIITEDDLWMNYGDPRNWASWLYSFFDEEVSAGVYYYTLWRRWKYGGFWGGAGDFHNIPIGGLPYMRVVVRQMILCKKITLLTLSQQRYFFCTFGKKYLVFSPLNEEKTYMQNKFQQPFI